MSANRRLTAIIEREGDGYVALCPELDVASEGEAVELARRNLIEALESFFEVADASEIAERLGTEVFVTSVEVVDRADPTGVPLDVRRRVAGQPPRRVKATVMDRRIEPGEQQLLERGAGLRRLRARSRRRPPSSKCQPRPARI